MPVLSCVSKKSCRPRGLPSTRYIVAYDIADDRQRERLAMALSDYGQRIGLSLFQLQLSARQLKLLLARIGALLAPDTDRVHIIKLCANCELAVRLLGKPWPRERHGVLVC